MEQNKIEKTFKNSARIIFNLFIYIFAFIGFMTVVYEHFDESGSCLDIGGVWDSGFDVWRQDCSHWNKNGGCEYIPDNELEKYVNGYCANEGKDLHRCKHAKLELSKRKLRDKMLKMGTMDKVK